MKSATLCWPTSSRLPELLACVYILSAVTATSLQNYTKGTAVCGCVVRMPQVPWVVGQCDVDRVRLSMQESQILPTGLIETCTHSPLMVAGEHPPLSKSDKTARIRKGQLGFGGAFGRETGRETMGPVIK